MFSNAAPPEIPGHGLGMRLRRDKPHIYLHGRYWRVSPMPRGSAGTALGRLWFDAYAVVIWNNYHYNYLELEAPSDH